MSMKKHFYLLTMITFIFVISGCADTQTKANEGAGIGGILGAAAGGIIGHQTHDTAAGMLIGGVVGAASGAAIGSQIPNPNPYPYPYFQPVPVVVAQPVPVVVPAATDTLSVNIPNDNGGYTVVILKRSGNGFVGPQGEFYPGFPRISQLKAMYGK